MEPLNKFKPDSSGASTIDSSRFYISSSHIDRYFDYTKSSLGLKSFYYIPVQCRDFYDKDLGKFDWLKEYDEGYESFACILNTDNSWGNGLQWCGIFGNFTDEDKYYVEFLHTDSSSKDDAISEIKYWLEKQVEKYSCGLGEKVILIETISKEPYLDIGNRLDDAYNKEFFIVPNLLTSEKSG